MSSVALKVAMTHSTFRPPPKTLFSVSLSFLEHSVTGGSDKGMENGIEGQVSRQLS